MNHDRASLARMLTEYKAWANRIVYSAVAALPEGEAEKPRATHFDSMVHTLNHVHVVDCIFKAHLEGKTHPYTSRNTPAHPPLQTLWQQVQAIDRWYVDHAAALPDAAFGETIRFQFVDGGDGAMSRLEILMHLANHGTYHRGFVGDMLNQAGVVPPSSDLTVFLRDVWRGA